MTADTAPSLPASIISIAGQGQSEGLDFTGYEGRRDLFFHLPGGQWLAGARLVLPYDATEATSSSARRTLTVLARGKVLRQIAVTGPGLVDVPVPADAAENGSLPITLVYSGGETANRCFDRRVGADHLHFDPAGGLALDIAPGAAVPVDVAASLVQAKPTVVVPAKPTPGQAAAALTVLAARGGGTLTSQPGATGGGFVQIGSPADPALRSIDQDGRTGLAIGGGDPAASARAAFSGLSALLAAPVVPQLSLQARRLDSLRFADLGGDSRVTDIADQGGWTIALPASRLPAGKTMRGLAIDVAAVPDGGREPAMVSAWMNGTLLGSVSLSPSGGTRLRVDVPAGLVHTMNGIEVRITRRHQEDCGEAARGWPAQLLGSSEVLLGKAGKITDFHDFAALAGQGVTVVVPGPSALPIAGRAVAGLFGGDVPIRVSYGALPAEGPILYIGATPPPGTEPRLATTGGRLRLAGDTGTADIDLPDSGTDTIAQLVAADGRPILWVRPATGGIVPASMWLDQGDAAIVAGDGAITPLSTEHDRLAPLIGPPAAAPWWETYNKWLFAFGGVLIGLLVVIWSLRPSVKKSRPGQDAS